MNKVFNNNFFSSISLNDLARWLYARKENGGDAPVLFLGAGISISKNVSNVMEQIDRFLVDAGCVDIDEVAGLAKEERFESFFQELEHFNEYDQQIWLSKGFNNIEPSPGYRKLTQLIEKGYFECILTSNWDNLLDVCLEQSALVRDKDYRIYIHGVTREAVIIRDFKRSRFPRIKVLKLNGDLAYKIFYATPGSACRFSDRLGNLVSETLSTNDIIMIGYSVVEKNIQKYIKQTANRLICVDTVSAHRSDFGSNFNSCCYVPEKEASFEDFMEKLYSKIMEREEPEFASSAFQKIDRLKELDSSLKEITVLLQKINKGIQEMAKDTEKTE